MMFSPRLGDPAQLVERPLHRVVVARRTATPATSAIGLGLRRAGSTLRMLLRRRPSGDGGGLGEAVDADDRELARLDAAHPLGVAAHEPALELVDGLEGAAEREHVVELGLRRLDQLGRLRLDDVRPVEEVVVLEQVGLEGEHLLDAQRPLLVPRAGQAERLVPRRQLDRPGPGVASTA